MENIASVLPITSNLSGWVETMYNQREIFLKKFKKYCKPKKCKGDPLCNNIKKKG